MTTDKFKRKTCKMVVKNSCNDSKIFDNANQGKQISRAYLNVSTLQNKLNYRRQLFYLTILLSNKWLMQSPD